MAENPAPASKSAATDSSAPATETTPMSHRAKIQSLTALIIAMFVGMIANTVVSTSMPRIVHDLGGTQAQYSWVIAASMLAMTVTVPIWGKLSDLLDRKMLMQVSLAIFVSATAFAGFSQSIDMLIGARVFQGIGIGGTMTLSQIVMADVISPRERGKYMGVFGAVMAFATVGGPLLGGWITDTFTWRYNFYIALPVAIVAFVMLQTRLHLPEQERRRFRLDVWGLVLLSGGISLFLIWVTMGGSGPSAMFPWKSVETLWMTSASAILLIAFVFVELRTDEPLLDLRLFKNRTFTLSVVGSIAVGLAMFGSTVYLSQFMIMARGASPTMAGVMTIPIMAGSMISGNVVGLIITRTGVWKPYVIACSVMLVAGLGLMSVVRADTNYWFMAALMFLMGAGMGGTMQNFVLLTQNAVHPRVMGVASSAVAFFRSMGGTVGIAWLGGVLANLAPSLIADRQQDLMAAIAKLPDGERASIMEMQSSGELPAPSMLPDSVATIIEHAYGEAIAHLFLYAAPIAALGLLAAIFIPNLSLSTHTRHEELARAAGESADKVTDHSGKAEELNSQIARQEVRRDV
ncbi:DHA2 family efflux MFS transporter permease subunit [Pseudoglutamicibacter cumminsii]|uniref:DHA2 family efflux MFS transporter permease subunit n=1 Tax=Pseudoglutamicibacter cumminsii TaxID=156979 RepID=UPI00195B4843|nr:EmrB/QacA subfamily drug resistance transporter [Pseudoglutamicibacter cumminsii]